MKTYFIATFLLACVMGKSFYAMDNKKLDTLTQLNIQTAQKYIEQGSVDIPYLEQIIQLPEVQKILTESKIDATVLIAMLKQHEVNMGTIINDTQAVYSFLEELKSASIHKVITKYSLMGLLVGATVVDLAYNGPSVFNLSVSAILSILMIKDTPEDMSVIQKSWHNMKKLGDAFIAYIHQHNAKNYPTQNQ